ncbi:MAG: D-alanine--D-alanine ligase family protein, partial [Longimicrobiales bacterium]
MKIALIFDDLESRPDAGPAERSVIETVDAVQAALVRLGHRPVRVPLGGPATRWCAAITVAQPDLVFNLCEGIDGASALEPHVAAFVELLGLPFTGSSGETLALARRKDRVNALLAARDVPVPEWTVVAAGDALPAWNRFPAIVKPAGEDGSVGITQQSVARDPAELADAIAAPRSIGPLIIQQFIAGGEVSVGLVGDHVLPLAEIDFTRMPAGVWRIVSYSAKWETGSVEDLGSAPVCPARLSAEESARLTFHACRAWRAVDGEGYGRIDFRIAEDGSPFVLDVNPNPDLAP